MLLITNDGRKLALDQRLMNDMLPDSETSKVGTCAENVFDIWQRTADLGQRLARLEQAGGEEDGAAAQDGAASSRKM